MLLCTCPVRCPKTFRPPDASLPSSRRSSRPKPSPSSPSSTGASNPAARNCLPRRAARQATFDAGAKPDFLAETKHVRDSDWQVAAQPKDLLDRRVEITGPTDRKMVINAL